MKAVRIHAHGGVEQLRYEEAPDPQVTSPRDVIVKLETAALNHVDIWNRIGVSATKIPMPHILGADGAGVVVDAGREVRSVRPGDRVCLYCFTGCGDCEFCLTDREFMCIRVRSLGSVLDGTYAEYVKVRPENCFPIPSYMTFDDGAAFPLAFVTLWRMLITNVRLQAGETLLVIGIGGGVAGAALQVGHRIGARVIVTSGSDAKLERAAALGANHGINHKKQDIVSEVMKLTDQRGVDVVVDSVAGEVWQKSLASLAPGGRLATCGATAGWQPDDDIDAIVSKNLKIYGSTLGSREDFRQVLNFLEATKTQPIIDRKFPLEQARAAQMRMEEGRQFGKILLQCAN